MTAAERRIAIKEKKEIINEEYNPELHKYTFKQILCAVLVGTGIATYVAMKATEPIVNVEALSMQGYIQEAEHWVREVFIPKLRDLPALWEAIKANNWLEHLTAAVTGIIAATGLWQGHKKGKLKQERNAEIREAVRGLRG